MRCQRRTGGRRPAALAGGAALYVVVLVALSPGAAAAPVKPGKPGKSGTQSPAPARGWVVDKVRFEPVDPTMPLTVPGEGDYRGALEVSSSGGGLATINDVGLEDYLRGIAEVPPNWPAEALKAQVIAARSYALHQAESTVPAPYKNAGADICATDGCQVYLGMAKERQDGAAGWLSAVAATAGQVLLYNGSPIFAEYSSSNGGRTVAGSYPYLKSVPDPDDAASSLSHWHYTVPLSSLAGMLGVSAPATLVSANRANDRITYQVQQPAPPQPATTTTATTATTAAPAGHAGQPTPPTTTPTTAPPPPPPPSSTQSIATGDFIAKANGGGLPTPDGMPMPFPSDRFGLASSGDTVTVDGRGYGHGVGLSQWGAYGKARRGMKAADILAAYYGGIRPTTLPADRLPATIRVALAVGQSSATVTAPGRFRVLDGSGKPLAQIALGRWQITSAGSGKVRVVPPDGYDQPLAITPGAVDPLVPAAGVPAALHYRVSTPAAVKLTVLAPGGKQETIDAGVVDAGEAVQPLPAPVHGGAYSVVIDADAGPGRQASIPFVFSVSGPARLVMPPAELLAAPHGQPLWDRTIAAWRSFPAPLPLLFAALMLIVNTAGLSALRFGRRWAYGGRARRLDVASAVGGADKPTD